MERAASRYLDGTDHTEAGSVDDDRAKIGQRSQYGKT